MSLFYSYIYGYLSKKLIVEYDKKSKETFKISNFDYESIENHLQSYGAFSIKKIG